MMLTESLLWKLLTIKLFANHLLVINQKPTLEGTPLLVTVGEKFGDNAGDKFEMYIILFRFSCDSLFIGFRLKFRLEVGGQATRGLKVSGNL